MSRNSDGCCGAICAPFAEGVDVPHVYISRQSEHTGWFGLDSYLVRKLLQSHYSRAERGRRPLQLNRKATVWPGTGTGTLDLCSLAPKNRSCDISHYLSGKVQGCTNLTA